MSLKAYIAVADADGLKQLYLASELCAGVAPLALEALTSQSPTCVAEIALEPHQADLIVAHLLRCRRRTALKLVHDYTHGKAHLIVGQRSAWLPNPRVN